MQLPLRRGLELLPQGSCFFVGSLLVSFFANYFFLKDSLIYNFKIVDIVQLYRFVLPAYPRIPQRCSSHFNNKVRHVLTNSVVVG